MVKKRDRRRVECGGSILGEMAEWSIAAVSKTVDRLPAVRGFESPSLRKAKTNHPDGTIGVVLFYE